MDQNKPYYNNSRDNHRSRESPRRRDNRYNSPKNNYRQSQPQRKSCQLPILLYLPAKYLTHLKDRNYFVFDNIEKKTRISTLEIDSKMTLNDPDYQTVRIDDKNTDRKVEAANILLDHYLNKHCLNQDPQDNSKKLLMLIPEQIVSLFIGKQGKNIRKLMDICRTQITISQPINEATHRTLEIKGKSDDVQYACTQVLFQQEKIVSKYDLQDFQPTNLDLENAVIKAKFALDRNFCNYVDRDLAMQNKHLNLQIQIEENFDSIQEINDNESICIIEGELKNVQTFVDQMIEKMWEGKDDQEQGQQPLKILIQNNFVLVSQKDGSMIKEIASKSHGAQIKILSNKKQEMNLKDCVVTVNGNQLRNKQEAAKIILEKLEIFRKGISFGQPEFEKNQISEQNYDNYNDLRKRDQNDFQRKRSFEMDRGQNYGGDRYQNQDRNKPQFDTRRRDETHDRDNRGNRHNQDYGRGRGGSKFQQRDSFQRNRNGDHADQYKRQSGGDRRNDRPQKYDRNDRYENRQERSNRNERFEGNERFDRNQRNDRTERGDRSDRYNRQDRNTKDNFDRRYQNEEQPYKSDRYEDKVKIEHKEESKKSDNQSSRFSRSRSMDSGKGSIDSKKSQKDKKEDDEFKIDFENLKYENEDMKDPNKNFSYLDENDKKFKIVQKILVPGYLANYMAQDKIKKAINDKRKELNCKIKVESEQDNFTLHNNVQGRQIRLEGSPESCSELFLFLTKLLMKIENSLNGVNEKSSQQNKD